MTLPYASARSGMSARGEIQKILQRFGCESVGFMDEFHANAVVLAFVWRGRNIQLRASAQGWANAFLKEEPWTSRRRTSREDYEQRALDQGMIAINSILRDWVKGQMTAVETGIFSFEHVFMPHMLTADGTPIIEKMSAQLQLEKPND